MSQPGSFYQWLSIIKAGSQEFHQEKAKEFAGECPNDGEPLRMGPDGRLYCPYDGWRPETLISSTATEPNI